MIIVSQNKDIIANFDNITSLDTDQCNGVYVVECNFTNRNNVFLGEYKSEERAKEVLQEIIKKYRDVTVVCDINNNKFEKYDLPKVYEMSKE